MAAAAEPAGERNSVDYRWMDSRSVLNRVQGRRVSFEWSINPYRGCEFGCVYCYARYTHDFMELRDPMDFERRVFAKRNAAGRLAAELRRGMVRPGETIALGAATDPYQPAERRFEITRSILQVLLRHKGFRLGLTTKSDLALRDLELWRELAARHLVSVRITVTTMNHRLARMLEPRAVTPQSRMEAVRRFNEAGVSAGVNLMPVMPGINDSEETLEEVVRAAAGAGASSLGCQALFLTQTPKRRFEVFLAESFPHHMERYRRLYAGGCNPPAAYAREVEGVVNRLRERHGVPSRCIIPWPLHTAPAEQLEMFS